MAEADSRSHTLDFFHHVSDHPNKQQRQELARQIQAIPGCQDYTASHVNTYFSNKRQAERRALEAHSMKRTKAEPSVAAAVSSSVMTTARICMPFSFLRSTRWLIGVVQCIQVSRMGQTHYITSRSSVWVTLLRRRRSPPSGQRASVTARHNRMS